MNLTAVKSGRETEIRHFLDSLSPLLLLKDTFSCDQTVKIIDIGSGAGFPGIPLAIMMPKAQFVLTDALQKRIRFLDETIEKLELNNVTAVCGRFEDLARDPVYRESFDLAVSRAVAEFRILLEFSVPFLKTNGLFVAYKGEEAKKEIDQAQNALSQLLSKRENVCFYNEECTGKERALVVVRKEADCPERYPRRNGIPSKRPL